MEEKPRIPVRMYSLKKFYDNYGMNWISTRDFKSLEITKAHMYELRGHLENKIWNEKMKNRNGSRVYAKGAMKIGNFWRITPRGLLALYEYFDIADENLQEVAKKLLLGEDDELL